MKIPGDGPPGADGESSQAIGSGSLCGGSAEIAVPEEGEVLLLICRARQGRGGWEGCSIDETGWAVVAGSNAVTAGVDEMALAFVPPAVQFGPGALAARGLLEVTLGR